MTTHYTPAEIAEARKVDKRVVDRWIKSGELAAVNCASSAHGKKPRWRISQLALDQFDASRSAQPPTPPLRRRRRADAGIIEFF
jgi:hypothetical protein